MSHDHLAEEINTAVKRALDVKPTLRRVSVLLWASFIGAACTLATLLLMPEGWPLPPVNLEDDTLLFCLLWLLALIPATVAGILFDAVDRPD